MLAGARNNRCRGDEDISPHSSHNVCYIYFSRTREAAANQNQRNRSGHLRLSGRACRYAWRYCATVLSQEKSAAIAFRRKWYSASGCLNNASALRMPLASAVAEYSLNLIPFAFSASSLASITVSSSPP